MQCMHLSALLQPVVNEWTKPIGLWMLAISILYTATDLKWERKRVEQGF